MAQSAWLRHVLKWCSKDHPRTVTCDPRASCCYSHKHLRFHTAAKQAVNHSQDTKHW